MLPKRVREGLFEKASVKTMRYVTAVPVRAATGAGPPHLRHDRRRLLHQRITHQSQSCARVARRHLAGRARGRAGFRPRRPHDQGGDGRHALLHQRLPVLCGHAGQPGSRQRKPPRSIEHLPGSRRCHRRPAAPCKARMGPRRGDGRPAGRHQFAVHTGRTARGHCHTVHVELRQSLQPRCDGRFAGR